MTSWGSCVLVDISYGELVFRLETPRFSRTHIPIFELEVRALFLILWCPDKRTYGRVVSWLYTRVSTSVSSALWLGFRAVTDCYWFLSRRWGRSTLGFRSGRHKDWWGDRWSAGREAFSCYQTPIAGRQQPDIPESVHSRSHSQEMLKMVIFWVQMSIWLMFFLTGSNNYSRLRESNWSQGTKLELIKLFFEGAVLRKFN